MQFSGNTQILFVWRVITNVVCTCIENCSYTSSHYAQFVDSR